jgi:hypothetical protein
MNRLHKVVRRIVDHVVGTTIAQLLNLSSCWATAGTAILAKDTACPHATTGAENEHLPLVMCPCQHHAVRRAVGRQGGGVGGH